MIEYQGEFTYSTVWELKSRVGTLLKENPKIIPKLVELGYKVEVSPEITFQYDDKDVEKYLVPAKKFLGIFTIRKSYVGSRIVPVKKMATKIIYTISACCDKDKV